jgi:hypothetical protein
MTLESLLYPALGSWLGLLPIVVEDNNYEILIPQDSQTFLSLDHPLIMVAAGIVVTQECIMMLQEHCPVLLKGFVQFCEV